MHIVWATLRVTLLGLQTETGSNRQALEVRCAAVDLEACYSLALDFYYGDSVEWPPEEGATRELDLAAQFFNLACEGGHAEGCESLARMYAEGEGVSSDPARAVELFSRACQLDATAGCIKLAWISTALY